MHFMLGSKGLWPTEHVQSVCLITLISLRGPLASLCSFVICQRHLCKVLRLKSSNRRDWYLEH